MPHPGRSATASDLGSTLRARRVALHLTQGETADLAGVSERFVRLAEQGKSSVQLVKLQQLSHALGLELALVARTPTSPS